MFSSSNRSMSIHSQPSTSLRLTRSEWRGQTVAVHAVVGIRIVAIVWPSGDEFLGTILHGKWKIIARTTVDIHVFRSNKWSLETDKRHEMNVQCWEAVSYANDWSKLHVYISSFYPISRQRERERGTEVYSKLSRPMCTQRKSDEVEDCFGKRREREEGKEEDMTSVMDQSSANFSFGYEYFYWNTHVHWYWCTRHAERENDIGLNRCDERMSGRGGWWSHRRERYIELVFNERVK